MRQSVLVMSAQVLGVAGAVVGNFLLAWMIGPQGKGLVYLLQLISGIGLTLLAFGLGQAAVYYSGRDRSFSAHAVFSGTLLASFLLGCIPLVLFGLLQSLWGHTGFEKIEERYLWIAFAAIPGMAVSVNASYLYLARGRTLGYNWLRVGPSVLLPGWLLLLLAWGTSSLLAVTIAWLLSAWLPSAILFSSLGNVRVRLRECTEFLRKAVPFGFRSHQGAVTQYLQHRADALFLGFLVPVADVGIYSVAVSLAELLWQVPNALSAVLLPHVASSSEQEVRRVTPAFVRAALVVTALISLGIAGLGSWLIPVLLPAFEKAVPLLWILLPGTVLASTFKVLASDLTGRGRPGETFRPAAIALVASVPAYLWAIPEYGMVGAAVVTTLAYWANAALCVHRYRRVTAVPVGELLVPRGKDFLAMNSALRALWP